MSNRRADQQAGTAERHADAFAARPSHADSKREPGTFLLRPIEFVFRMAAMVIMLGLWSTIGLVVCSFVAIRTLLWMSAKNVSNALLDRPFSELQHFTSAVLLWPRKVIEFVRWGFGYVEAPRTQVRHPGELILETLLICFFFVTLIWANETKPGYLPNVLAIWFWLVNHTIAWAIKALGVVMQLLGAPRP